MKKALDEHGWRRFTVAARFATDHIINLMMSLSGRMPVKQHDNLFKAIDVAKFKHIVDDEIARQLGNPIAASIPIYGPAEKAGSVPAWVDVAAHQIVDKLDLMMNNAMDFSFGECDRNPVADERDLFDLKLRQMIAPIISKAYLKWELEKDAR